MVSNRRVSTTVDDIKDEDTDSLFKAVSDTIYPNRVMAAKLQSQVLNLLWQLGEMNQGDKIDLPWVEKLDGRGEHGVDELLVDEGKKWGTHFELVTRVPFSPLSPLPPLSATVHFRKYI